MASIPFETTVAATIRMQAGPRMLATIQRRMQRIASCHGLRRGTPRSPAARSTAGCSGPHGQTAVGLPAAWAAVEPAVVAAAETAGSAVVKAEMPAAAMHRTRSTAAEPVGSISSPQKATPWFDPQSIPSLNGAMAEQSTSLH